MVHLNANMLTMHPGIATNEDSNKVLISDVAKAVDGDAGGAANSFPEGWAMCVNSVSRLGPHWLAVNLKGVFLISRVRATFRYASGNNVAVFVGNNPSATDGRDVYTCGQRWTQNVQQAPRFHNFTCQPSRWASHVSVQREAQYLQVCEVEVYYTQYTAVGMPFTLTFHNTSTLIAVRRVCCVHAGVNVSFTSALASPLTVTVGEPLLCTTRLVSSDATRLLQLQWLFPNGTVVSQRSHGNVTQQHNVNSVGLSFNSLTAPNLKGNYLCNYTLNGKQRSHIVSVSGERQN